jgi:cell division cycle 14
LHEVLADNPDRAVVFWTGPDAKCKWTINRILNKGLHIIVRSNAACILACYVVLIQGWPPHLALAPIAQMNPPCMPFRDAGYSVADYGLTIQDIVYGVWKAKEEKLCELNNFSLEEYVYLPFCDMKQS